jgi:hypothetical protein
MYYTEAGKRTGWGYEVPEDNSVESISWFKLALVEENKLPSHLKESEQLKKTKLMLKRLQKDAVDITAEYCKSTKAGDGFILSLTCGLQCIFFGNMRSGKWERN